MCNLQCLTKAEAEIGQPQPNERQDEITSEVVHEYKVEAIFLIKRQV